MGTLAQVAVAGAAMAVVAAIALWARRLLRSAPPAVALVAAGASVAFSLAADSSATGSAAYDACLRVAVGLAFVLASSYCTAGPRLAAAALLLVGSIAGSGGAWPAAAAFGGSLALVLVATDGPAVGAVLGLALGQAALRQTWPATIGATAAIGTAALAILAIGALPRFRRSTRRVVWWIAAAVAVAAFLAIGAWAVALVSVRGDLTRAVDVANSGLDAARGGDTTTAAARLDEAAALFGSAQDRLGAWWARMAGAVPVVAQNARALRVMSDSGRELSSTGADTARSADPDDIKPSNGTVPLDRIRALDAPLTRASATLARARVALGDIESPWLVSTLVHKLDSLRAKVARAARDAKTTQLAVDVVPGLLGGAGERQYFVAFQNPAEQRADGGVIGNFAVVSYRDGHVELVRNARESDFNLANPGTPRTLDGPEEYRRRYGYSTPERVIQNVTLSPDFPSVAAVLEGVYPQAGGTPVDGVVSMDPVAVAAFLKLTGNVELPRYGVVLTPDTAADILLRRQYELYPDPEVRAEFLRAAVQGLFDRLQSTELPGPSRIGEILGPMVRQGRLQLHSTRTDEEAFFRRVGAARAFPRPRGDVLGVVTQNGAGNKIDVFQHRTVRYDARVDPGTGVVHSEATVRIRNDAPPSGLSDDVIGSFPDNPLPRGTSRVLLSVYSPLQLDSATVDAATVEMLRDTEFAGNVYSTRVDIGPGEERVVRLRLTGPVALGRVDRRYRLVLWRQATVDPDSVGVAVRAAPGWETTAVQELGAGGSGAAQDGATLERDVVSARFRAK